MRLLSWNIQYGQGVDRQLRLDRVITAIEEFGQLDIICLQEVARHFPDYCTSEIPDQLQALMEAFPSYQPIWGSGMNWYQPDGPTRQFGNLTLVAGVILDWRVHQLPRPPADSCKQIPRVAVETVVQTGSRPLRILNVHLAYHHHGERRAQVEYLLGLQQAHQLAEESPARTAGGAYADLFRSSQTILCGDCNFTPEDWEFSRMSELLTDAWSQLYGRGGRAPTCGVHDRELWPIGPHCRDYFWLSRDIAGRAGRMLVDQQCRASDHQPVILEIDF